MNIIIEGTPEEIAELVQTIKEQKGHEGKETETPSEMLKQFVAESARNMQETVRRKATPIINY